MEIENVFWMVWSSGTYAALRESEVSAIAEAKRMAKAQPEKVFYVLKAISRFEAIRQPVAETMLLEPHERIATLKVGM